MTVTTMRCPSCTACVSDHIQEGEALFHAKARLRADLGERCPRTQSTARVPCPMRGDRREETPSL